MFQRIVNNSFKPAVYVIAPFIQILPYFLSSPDGGI